MRVQGYSPSQIVVLTPYLGQVRLLIAALSRGDIGVLIGELDLEELQQEGEGLDDDAVLCSADSDDSGGAAFLCCSCGACVRMLMMTLEILQQYTWRL